MPDRFEFVVVGGGVFGAATAWELASRGSAVALFEANEIASGASGGPGKRGVRANSRDPAELPLSRLANEIWPQLDNELGAATGYERVGGLELYETAGARQRVDQQVALQREHGIATEHLSRDALLELEPHLSDRIAGAVYCPNDGVAGQTATTRAYARAAEQRGVVVRTGVTIQRIEASSGRVAARVDANDARTEAERAVIVLTNAQAPALLATAGVSLSLPRVFPQIVLLPPVPRLDVRRLVGHLERRVVVKQLPSGEFMISGGWLGRENKASGIGEAIEANVAANLDDAAAVFPALEGVSPIAAVADRAESVGPVLLPIIDRAPGFEDLYVATGWSGHGFAIAPAVARLLASWALGGDRPAEFAPFAWRQE